MKATRVRYTLVSSKLHRFVDTKFFIANINTQMSHQNFIILSISVLAIKRYSPVEQMQIKDTDLMVTTQSG